MGKCRTAGERSERAMLKAARKKSYWSHNILLNKDGRPMRGVPTGQEIREKHARDWEADWEAKRPIRESSNHKRGQKRRRHSFSSHDDDYRSRDSFVSRSRLY